MKIFNPSSPHPERARQAWQILIGGAMNRQSFTYESLSKLMYRKAAQGVLDKILGHIAYYCIANEIPILTVLVVNKETGEPGSDIPLKYEEIHREREKVYQYDWYNIQAPSTAALKKAFKTEGKKV